MSESLAAFRTRVMNWGRVPATGQKVVVTQDQLDQAIVAAVRSYTGKNPLRLNDQLSGNGPEFDLTTATGWTGGVVTAVFSDSAMCKSPHPWRVYRRGSTPYLRTGQSNPWIEFTARHQIDADEANTTIPWEDLDIVAKLAAANAIKQQAADAADAKSSTVNTNATYASVMTDLLTMADKYKAEFDEKNWGWNSGFSEWDIKAANGSRMIFHGGRAF